MSKMYDVKDGKDESSSLYIGKTTKFRAIRAIDMGIAKHHSDKLKKVIYVNAGSIEHFNEVYRKENIKYLKRERQRSCWNCNKEIEVPVRYAKERAYCKKCDKILSSINAKDRKEFTRLRTKFMYDRGIKIIENQSRSFKIEEYKEAAKVVESYMEENPGKIDSSYEVAAAVQLIKDKIHIVMQKDIAGYKADITLLDEKIVIEIDGYHHDKRVEKDYEIDLLMREELGDDWEIIRIPTKYIDENISMLYEAAMEMKIHRQQLRKDNYGMLPANFSNREKRVWGR